MLRSSETLIYMVPGAGLEPARYCYRGILSLFRVQYFSRLQHKRTPNNSGFWLIATVLDGFVPLRISTSNEGSTPPCSTTSERVGSTFHDPAPSQGPNRDRIQTNLIRRTMALIAMQLQCGSYTRAFLCGTPA